MPPVGTISPPSTTRDVPVMKEAQSLAKKAIAFATSSGRPILPSGCMLPKVCRTRSGDAALLAVQCSIGVSMAPGHTQFTRMFLEAKSTATERVIPSNACLAATYAAESFTAVKLWAEPTITMAPPPAATMTGIAYLAAWKHPFTCTSKVSSHISELVLARSPYR